jgi:coenzyme F420-dependent glucose-6-phosphate dehydrogenase
MTGSNHNVVGYWPSQEQYSMQDLLKFVVESETDGLKTCFTSDHMRLKILN